MAVETFSPIGGLRRKYGKGGAYGGLADANGILVPTGKLAKRPSLKKSGPAGRFVSISAGAATTHHYQTVLEAKPVLMRIWVLNALPVALSGVRVSVAAATTIGDNNSTTSIDPTAAGGTWQNGLWTQPQPLAFTAALSAATSGTLASSWGNATGSYPVTFSDGSVRYVTLTNAATTATWSGAVTATAAATVAVAALPGQVAAGLTVDNVGATPTDWISCTGLDTTDASGLFPVHIRLEFDSSNANLGVYNWSDMSGWEDPANVGGRIWRTRSQATTGVQTKGNFTSTTFDGRVVPIIIEYIPAESVHGFTAALNGDSMVEQTGASVRNYGWAYRAQRMVSTPAAPVEICNLAINGAASSRYPMRAALQALLKCEVWHQQNYTVNSAGGGLGSPANPLLASDLVGMQYNAGLAKAALIDYDTFVVNLPGMPSNTALKAYGSSDALRLAYNERFNSLPDGRSATLDLASVYSGDPDASGQVQIRSGYTTDGVHPNDAGHDALAVPTAALWRHLLLMV